MLGGSSLINQKEFLTTREVSEHLQVHARTIRKWIDVFEDYIGPDLNERGHYILSEDSLERLMDIKERLAVPNQSMKQVREDLKFEGKLTIPATAASVSQEDSTSLPNVTQEKTMQKVMSTMNQMGDLMEELFERMDRMEDHMYTIFETFEDMEHKLVSLNLDRISGNDVHQMFDEIRKKQDQLKLELRNVHFTQKLSAAASEQPVVPKRQKRGKFLFFF